MKNPMVEYLTIKRKVNELNKYINNSGYSRKESLESFTNALLENIRNEYREKLGSEFDSQELLAEKIEGNM